jgi:transposase
MNNIINQSRSEAQAKEEQVTKFGLDVHASQITVCRQQGGLLPQPAQKMSWERCLNWIGEHVANGEKVYSCYEAGPCGFSLHRDLAAMGVSNYVVAAQRWDERGRRIKTDKRDARELTDRLDRYVRGNTKAFAVIHVPTPELEQKRGLVRQRAMVLKERNRCVLRGYGMMLSQGFRAAEEWWKPLKWVKFQEQLPGWLRERVGFWQHKALNFTKDLEELNKQVEGLVVDKVIPKGLGQLTSAILESEIIDWNRFKNRKQISSYTGLCPSEDSSGEKRKQGSIDKCGNSYLRHQLIEAIWRLEMWQPNYEPIKKLRETKGSRGRKRAAVAAARRFIVDLWRIETGQSSAQKLGLILVKPSNKA